MVNEYFFKSQAYPACGFAFDPNSLRFEMNFDYTFLGVGIAISVLGFFLKKEAAKHAQSEQKISELEILLATNEVRDVERWKVATKLLEDRRSDIKNIFKKLESKVDK